MSLVSIKEVTDLISEDIPAVGEMGIIFEIVSDSLVRARLPFDASSLRPGGTCLLYTSPSPRDQRGSRMPSSA